MKKIGFLFIVLFLSACVSGNDFDRVRSDLHELQRSTFETRKEIDSLKEKTSGVVREDSFTAVKESQADLFSKVTATSSGLQELRGRFDENRYFTEKSLKEAASEKDLLKAQIAALETQVRILKDKISSLEGRSKEPLKEAADAANKQADSASSEPAVPEAKKTEPAADSRTKAYDAAYQLFKDNKWKESRERFEAFLRDHPKTDLTDNAQFWIAESYYHEKDFESAILSYETLLKKYPDSDKASSGMLKQGSAFVEIGDAKTGKIILNKLLEKYPNSKDAEAAKKKIAELDRKPQKKR
ncbi:MAG: tol-pal system protein YbgF [Nitrospirae bacterium]|nr:tol-pal system protein YbgF [Nitrospirota bacterium]